MKSSLRLGTYNNHNSSFNSPAYTTRIYEYNLYICIFEIHARFFQVNKKQHDCLHLIAEYLLQLAEKYSQVTFLLIADLSQQFSISSGKI